MARLAISALGASAWRRWSAQVLLVSSFRLGCSQSHPEIAIGRYAPMAAWYSIRLPSSMAVVAAQRGHEGLQIVSDAAVVISVVAAVMEMQSKP